MPILSIRSVRQTLSTSEFFQESFGAIREAGTETLILDVRNNGGGADELGKLLLSYLLDKPFKYYDDLSQRGGVQSHPASLLADR